MSVNTLGMSRPFHSGLFNTEVTVTRYTHTKQADGSYVSASSSTVYAGPARFVPGGSREDWSQLRKETGFIDGTLWLPRWVEGTETAVRVDDRVTIDSIDYQVVGLPTPEGGDGRLLRVPLEREADA